jgi:two-component system repressor protein LuxO
MSAHLLIIEDTATMAALYVSYFELAGYTADIAPDGAKGIALLSQKSYAGVILDLHLPDTDGVEVLKHIRSYYEELPVIVVAACGSLSAAVESMRLGAFDFIMKPFSASRLNATVHNALENSRMRRELQELRRGMYQQNYRDFVGSSPVMQAMFRQIEAVAPSRTSLLITGEPGTGREMAALAVHRASPRAPLPFVRVDCAAFTPEKLEKEIFGDDHPGAIKKADGGTLFLDEISTMDIETQAKFVRFLQTHTYTPLNTDNVERADVRFICTSSHDLLKEIEDGNLREDLYYRLQSSPIEVPALRERDDDIALLTHHFLKIYNGEARKKFHSVAPEVFSAFRRYEWPGNVTQLQDLIRHIVALYDETVITMRMLPESMHLQKQDIAATTIAEPFAIKPLWQIEKEAILKTLRICQNDMSRAATLLEVCPSTLYRKLQGWRVELPEEQRNVA